MCVLVRLDHSCGGSREPLNDVDSLVVLEFGRHDFVKFGQFVTRIRGQLGTFWIRASGISVCVAQRPRFHLRRLVGSSSCDFASINRISAYGL